MRIVRALDVKKATYELTGTFAKVGTPQADRECSEPPENFHKNIISLKFVVRTGD